MLLRLLLAVLGVAEMSSIMHLASDAAEMVVTGELPVHEDGDDDDCPVGCPNCHTPHAAASLPASDEPAAHVALAPQARRPRETLDDSGRAWRPRASIERPPRRTA